MGFMGSMPIAGVIWQHIHYIVGLKQLGHDVYYLEDSARLPYNPGTFDVSEDLSYAARILDRLSREFDFKDRWAFCARYLKGKSHGRPLAFENPSTLSRCRCDLQRLRNARVQYGSAGEQSHPLCGERSRCGANQDRQGRKIDNRLSGATSRFFTFGENVGTKNFPVPVHGFRWLPTRQPVVTRFWETNRRSGRAAVFTSVANWSTSGQKDIVWRGKKYLWSKSREFSRFIAAPKKRVKYSSWPRT